MRESSVSSPCGRYRLLSRPKPVSWGGVKWTAVDDAKLLIGVLEHGLGSWEAIKADSSLGLGKKVLLAQPSLYDILPTVCVCVCRSYLWCAQ